MIQYADRLQNVAVNRKKSSGLVHIYDILCELQTDVHRLYT